MAVSPKSNVYKNIWTTALTKPKQTATYFKMYHLRYKFHYSMARFVNARSINMKKSSCLSNYVVMEAVDKRRDKQIRIRHFPVCIIIKKACKNRAMSKIYQDWSSERLAWRRSRIACLSIMKVLIGSVCT